MTMSGDQLLLSLLFKRKEITAAAAVPSSYRPHNKQPIQIYTIFYILFSETIELKSPAATGQTKGLAVLEIIKLRASEPKRPEHIVNANCQCKSIAKTPWMGLELCKCAFRYFIRFHIHCYRNCSPAEYRNVSCTNLHRCSSFHLLMCPRDAIGCNASSTYFCETVKSTGKTSCCRLHVATSIAHHRQYIYRLTD